MNPELLDKIVELFTVWGIKVLAALLILVIGRWIAKLITSVIRKLLEKREVAPMVVSFTSNIAYAVLLTFVVIAALGQLGIQTASFVAVLAAAGLAIGLALQGSLSNFAAGFLIVLFRPFRVGHYVEAAGVTGTVTDIHVFTTTFTTPDNKLVIIPNAQITGGNITNYSANDTRRVDLVIGVSYGDNLDKVRSVLVDVLNADNRVLKDPEPMIVVLELADSSVNFGVRPWVKTDDYWGAYFDLTETIKKRFDAEGISIPFPQNDVHLFNESSEG